MLIPSGFEILQKNNVLCVCNLYKILNTLANSCALKRLEIEHLC